MDDLTGVRDVVIVVTLVAWVILKHPRRRRGPFRAQDRLPVRRARH
jgi:hypothetical protein